jgi:hypothetical protein
MFLPVSLMSIGLLTWCFREMDQRLSYLGFQRPYYGVHAFHNACIVALTAGDVAAAFTEPGFGLTRPITWGAVLLCYALHLYHIWEYVAAFRFDDWLHHGLMIGIALPMGSMVPSGALMGFNLFFTTGLPGGISYALMFAQRNGWITRETETSMNARAHLWIRVPGCVAHAALTLAAGLSNPATTAFYDVVTVLVAALTAWNGLYFANQAVRADERRLAAPQ